jgi:hypothetical protein
MKNLNPLYLGRPVDAKNCTMDHPLTYPLDHLTTHALLLGATGSGKTGLGLVIAEEVLRQGVPTLLLDVKGDLANLLLTFPNQDASSFIPWIDRDAAQRRGSTPTEAAEEIANRSQQRLSRWGLSSEDIAQLREKVDLHLVTPGLQAGRPVNILARFQAIPSQDPDEASLRAQGLASALLGLAGIDADPVHSREHILLTTLIRHRWTENHALDLPTLIRQVQHPPIEQVGVFDLESFYPEDDRFDLALTLNNLIAAPGFARWRTGAPLDVDRYLEAPDGRPRATILYLAHLPESERQFFVTLFLEELRTWVRHQSGTSALRALLFFDEVYGYLPPHPYNPSTKRPLMALVKQGRAAGLGVMLSTQNPADIDYKSLGNIGTWFIGTLRTDRDKDRVLEGIEGSLMASGTRVRDIEDAIGRLEPRIFVMHDANARRLAFLHSRWALSYLRGPMTTQEIRTLLGSETTSRVRSTPESLTNPTAIEQRSGVSIATSSQSPLKLSSSLPSVPPAVDPEIPQTFLPATATAAWALRQHRLPVRAVETAHLVYRPSLLGIGTARVYDDRAGISLTDEQVWRVEGIKEAWNLRWDQGSMIALRMEDLSPEPPGRGSFAALPRPLARPSAYREWERELKTQIYHQSEIRIWGCTPLDLFSKPHETKGAFLQRCKKVLEAQKRDDLAEAWQTYQRKVARLEKRIRREEMELEKDEEELQERKREELLSGAETVLSLFSRRRRSRRALSQTSRQRRYVKNARADVEESVEMLRIHEQELTRLEDDWALTRSQVKRKWDSTLDEVQEIVIRARQRDIEIRFCGIGWFPRWEVTFEGEDISLNAYTP